MVYIIHIKKEMIAIRLWHYKLIPYLPRDMLVSQWRECIAIKRQWEKGTLKHRLVSYVDDYDKVYFLRYVDMVLQEMDKRNIKWQKKYYDEIFEYCYKTITYTDYYDGLLYKEHNDRYLKQCLYNLQEKADRGIVSKEDWLEIEKEFWWFL